MENLTNTDLMLSFKQYDIEANIFWNGGNKCSYTFLINGKEVMRGNDFKPSVMYNIDDNQTMISLLAFMCVKPGDTDPDYFNEHTPEHLNWLNSQEREDLNLLLGDMEFKNDDDPEMQEYYQQSLEFLTKNIVHY